MKRNWIAAKWALLVLLQIVHFGCNADDSPTVPTEPVEPIVVVARWCATGIDSQRMEFSTARQGQVELVGEFDLDSVNLTVPEGTGCSSTTSVTVDYRDHQSWFPLDPDGGFKLEAANFGLIAVRTGEGGFGGILRASLTDGCAFREDWNAPVPCS